MKSLVSSPELLSSIFALPVKAGLATFGLVPFQFHQRQYDPCCVPMLEAT